MLYNMYIIKNKEKREKTEFVRKKKKWYNESSID